MAVPFFYIPDFNPHQSGTELDENTSAHVIQVLRMRVGDQLNLTDGKGKLITASIIDDHKKHCQVKFENIRDVLAPVKKTAIAISLLKNTNRFEWFLEKSTELGINEIIPLICERTEKEKFRLDRMQQICISAMLQSQQCWLPHLHLPVQFRDAINQCKQAQRFFAWCGHAENKKDLNDTGLFKDVVVFIGPEGDFADSEHQLAISAGFILVSLGNTRLRTETAGITAAVMLTR